MESSLGISSDELPARLHEALEEALNTNEQLLWVDVPIARDVALKTVPFTIAGLIGFAFLPFWDVPEEPLAILLAVGVIASSWPLVSWLRATQTAYAITPSKLIVVGCFGSSVRSVPIDEIEALDIHLWNFGSGTMRFYDRLGLQGAESANPPAVVFKSIKNVMGGAELIQSLRELPLPTVS